VRSSQSVEVNWQTTGKVGSVSANIGQPVQAGDELAALDPSSLPTSIIQAQSDLIDAQDALEELQKPQPLEIAQAQSALEDAKSALNDLLNPSETAIAEAQTAVLDAQEAVDTAQGHVDGLKYARASQETIAAAQAAYLVAQSEVNRLEKIYNKTKGDPTRDAGKALALSNLEAARTRRDRALANLNWYQGKPTQAEIDKKNTDLALAKAQLADAQEALQKLTNPTAEDIALAEAVVADAQQTLDTLKAGPTQNDLTVARTRVTLAQAALSQARLTAPFAGTITDIHVMAGDMVSSGKAAFRIDDLSRLYVDLQVSEVDVLQIQTGQAATLTFDAVSDKEYHGKVTKIGLVGSVSQGVVNYPVTVEITDADASVLPGMTAAVSIVVAQQADVLVVPNQAIHSTGTQRTVTVLFEGQQISVPVTVGLVGDAATEVTGNSLREGDEVVVNASASSSSINQNRGEFGGRFEEPGVIFP
jgi:HlyD family secretion protein